MFVVCPVPFHQLGPGAGSTLATLLPRAVQYVFMCIPFKCIGKSQSNRETDHASSPEVLVSIAKECLKSKILT